MEKSPVFPRLISVIIPAYNAADTLGEQLDALKAQTYGGEWEIIVVDNRSTDGTGGLACGYQQAMPRLRLVQAPDRAGRAYACNVGARAAQGDAFVFCDADDVVAPGWLQAFAEGLAEADLVAGAVEVETLNPANAWRPEPANWATRANLDFLPFAGGGIMAVSRRAFEAIGGLDETAPFCEDIVFSWRLQLAGYRLDHAPGALIHYRYRSTSAAMWRQTVNFAEAHAYLYKCFAAAGMPRSSLRLAGRYYRRLLLKGLRWRSLDESARRAFVYRLAVCWGRLRGSLKYRVLML